MEYAILHKKDMGAFMDALAKKYQLLGPVSTGRQIKFAPVSVPGDMCLDLYTNSAMSPKELFFPQSETMLTFRKSGKDAFIYKESVNKPLPTAVFGIRPCDARAFALLDRIFVNDKFSDTYWTVKRYATVLIGLGCNEPGTSCFCTAVKANPFDEKGLDILAADLGDKYLLKVVTEKGGILLEGILCLSNPSKADIARQNEICKKAEDTIAANPKTGKLAKKTVLELFNDGFWAEAGESCLNCGTCSFVCPTCHCFDIQDEGLKDGGVRMRNWDTCMSWLFTVHATGHNPRPSKTERFRQRFMHKFKYIPIKQNNEFGCVGCGRCITACPVNVDVREVVNLMNA